MHLIQLMFIFILFIYLFYLYICVTLCVCMCMYNAFNTNDYFYLYIYLIYKFICLSVSLSLYVSNPINLKADGITLKKWPRFTRLLNHDVTTVSVISRWVEAISNHIHLSKVSLMDNAMIGHICPLITLLSRCNAAVVRQSRIQALNTLPSMERTSCSARAQAVLSLSSWTSCLPNPPKRPWETL